MKGGGGREGDVIGCRELRRYVKGEAKGAAVFGEASGGRVRWAGL